MFRRTGPALLALFLSMPGLLTAQYFGRNKVQYTNFGFKVIQTEHFDVYYYDRERTAALDAARMAERSYARLSKVLNHEFRERKPIILYASHSDFLQTNATEVSGEGTGGVTDFARNRAVMPFTGAYADFEHVLGHEMAHQFQYDIWSRGRAGAGLNTLIAIAPPLWFAEGMAEYFSLGMEPAAEMYVRDGTLTGYLPPLNAAGGYLVYKMGQSAVEFLIQKRGEERFRDLMRRARQMHNFDRAFQRTYGLSPQRFDQQWREMLRKRYWPTVSRLEHPETFGRRLTDHRRDESVLNF